MNDRKRFTLRMDAELFEKIEKLAEKNKRSIAKEIEYLLDQHLNEEDTSDNKKD